MVLHIWHNVLLSLSTIPHIVTSISHYHTLFPSLILSYHLHAGLSNAHSPSPNYLSRQAVCMMKLLSCNTLCMNVSLHSTHYTVLSSCCPFECCSGWPLHLQTYQPSHICRWPHLRYEYCHYCESKYKPSENRLTQQTDCHPNLGKIFLLCWSVIIKYSACVGLVFHRESSSNTRENQNVKAKYI